MSVKNEVPPANIVNMSAEEPQEPDEKKQGWNWKSFFFMLLILCALSVVLNIVETELMKYLEKKQKERNRRERA